jgi:hypothetical protein
MRSEIRESNEAVGDEREEVEGVRVELEGILQVRIGEGVVPLAE